MRKSTILAAAAGAVLSAAAGLSHAQVADLRPGATVEGALETTDPVAPGWDDAGPGHHHDDYRITARAGQRFEAVMRSSDFDAYLSLYREDAPGVEITSDDDGLGEGTDSRLRFTADRDGAYVLRARSLADGETGAYALTLTDRGRAPRAPRPGRIRLGQTIDGELDDRDPEAQDGGAYDAYAIRLRADERVAIRLTSDAFDTLVRVGRGSAFEEVAMNDDGGGAGLNSYLLFTAPQAGEYIIRATAFSPDAGGAYSLSMETPPPPRVHQPVTIGDTVEGRLDAEDTPDEAGVINDSYVFSARAGDRVAIGLSSSDFDPYLVLGREGASGFESLGEDDDGAGEGLNSRLVHTFAEDGAYVILARALGMGEGDYSLTLETVAPDPAARPLPFGETLQDSIGGDDGLDDMGRRFDAWVVEGVAGQRIQAIMRSGDFDTYLQIAAEDEPADTLASDDDGLREGTDSRLNFTLPETGRYILRASPLGSGGSGLYSLELTDRGPEPAEGSMIIGATARGELDERDSTAEDGSFYDPYRFRAEAGDRLRISMISNAFDALVVMGRQAAGGEFEAVASDDDGLSDTHALLEHTVEEAGDYVLRAGSFGPGAEGDYVLILERQE